MGTGFVVMQIGNDELDRVYDGAIRVAIEDSGLEPKRIDLDNEGVLLKNEIVAYLESSEIIVADLTNERPNCYLEVGYAMGLGRYQNLILTVREDHHPGNEGYSTAGPKVHFDLAGYDLLFWNPDELSDFRGRLTERIRRRMAIVGATFSTAGSTSASWFDEARDYALAALRSEGDRGFMEVTFGLELPKVERTQAELLAAARAAEIKTFGWPIGIVIDRDEYRPRPTGEGIRAELSLDRWSGEERSYDFWELRVNGDFFLLQSLFEDQRGDAESLYFNTRIVRATEAVLYCARLYERLGVEPDRRVHLRLRHGGLAGRALTSSSPGRHLSENYRCAADVADIEVSFRLGEVASDLVPIVQQLIAPLFQLFDFFELGPSVYADVVNRFVDGEVS